MIGRATLVVGASGRASLLAAGEDERKAQARLDADPEALAREIVESGVLNWSGPETIVVAVSGGGEAMIPETAKACVDAAFATPRPALTIEIADDDGSGWPAAWFAIEYARRRAEWGNRGLGLVYRTRTAPAPAVAERLAAARVIARAEISADGPPARPPFPAARVLARVGPRAADPDGWARALSEARVEGVEWVPARGAAPAKFAAFAAKALARIIDDCETSDLRDETAVALLRARPWEIPGVDLLSTLAFAPDGRVFSSEEGRRLAEETGAPFELGHASTFRFQDLPSNPVVPALLSAAVNATQPLCASCAYKSFCVIPPSSHFRDQGSLPGRLPDSPSCASRLALLDAVFSRISDEKCLKALQKWGVDIRRFTC